MKFISSFKKTFFQKRLIPFWLIGCMLACNSLEEIDLNKKRDEFPDRTLINAQLFYKDSGRIVIDLRSPKIEEFSTIDTPYTLFSKGLELYFYQKNSDSPGYLRANWATMSEMRGWYEGRGDVVVISEKGDTLKTQKLFWNKKTKKIFTQDTVLMISIIGDTLQANNGLEAKDDLSEYTLFNNQGTKYFNEEN